MLRGRNDGAEAIAKIRAIDSAWAITALAELLKDPQEPKQLVLEYIDVLGRFNSSVATAALLERAVKDSDLDIAERCLKILKTRGTDQAVAVLSKLLKDKDNAVVNRGAWALGELGSVDTIPALIDALVTKHRFKVQSGNPGNMTMGFDSTGGNSLQTGGGRRSWITICPTSRCCPPCGSSCRRESTSVTTRAAGRTGTRCRESPRPGPATGFLIRAPDAGRCPQPT